MFKKINSALLKCRRVFQNIQTRKQSDEVEIVLNGKAVKVPSYFTILQACRREKVTLPSFCYHERLSIAGNCRMCIVQVEGQWKPQIACSVHVAKGMKIHTNSPVTYQAQEGVLEFILADHPLDCPICDQGGECDLQDLSMRFGNDRSRYTDIHFDGKRAVENKELSPLIRAVMNRCIHCTRCIRFASQICGLDVLGTSGRGYDMLVGTFVDKMFLSELSGNIIDLCPVGALTSIPYMFKGRSWELMRANSIDVTDAVGSNIVVNYRFDRVLRVLPREHEEINQEWLSDKGRWAIDSLEMQRLVLPMLKQTDCCISLEWHDALKLACQMVRCAKPEKILAIAGPHASVETLVVAKDFLNMIGCENTYIERGMPGLGSSGDIRAGYSLNIKMSEVAQADKILFVGTNPRFEAPILNAWIRQAYRNNEADIYVIGPQCEFNYHVTYLGNAVSDLSKAADAMKGAKKPLIFVGIDQLDTKYGGHIMKSLFQLATSLKAPKGWEVLNVLPLEASFAGALEAGWKPGAKELLNKEGKMDLLISFGADQMFYDWEPPIGSKSKMIYIGFQGDRGAELAELILPGCAYTEAGGVYLNMECRSQYAFQAVSPPGKARQDWKIVRALAEYCGICLRYCDHKTLCTRLAQISPLFSHIGQFEPRVYMDLVGQLLCVDNTQGLDKCKLNVAMEELEDYYCSDIFSYNSPTMVSAKKAAKQFAKSHYAKV
ncbi:NADH-ubiquinone oxidoreductase 75 kDa subunit, mitochondrial-like [Anticarsia gemmatalis]|uniref:NADH-ubiquinone oxidoreductase 75 kDa subunit, mitochondrial-like n=1 Tax=Anticarsia gemmatalis TaxID=129554 RepID=UPI003F757351